MVRTKVFVGNLSFHTKEPELATEFAVAGKVISANIITRGPRSLGYGFVELDSEDDANHAVQVMNKKEINGRPINVEIARPQDESKIRKPRSPRVEGENRPRRRQRRNIRNRTEEGGEEQVDRRNQNVGKREEDEARPLPRRGPPRRPRYRRRYNGPPRERRIPNEEREESKTTLFVANLPFSLDDDAFAKIIADLNLNLESAHVVKKRNGRSKGYGFIEFDTQENQQKALVVLNKKVVDLRELSVKVALTEIRREHVEGESRPVEKKIAPAEKNIPPTEKNTASVEKKTFEKVVSTEKTPPIEKKTAPIEKKTAYTEKKPESKVVPEKNTASVEKKTAYAEKKPSTPDKKEDKKPSTPDKKEDKKPSTPDKKEDKKPSTPDKKEDKQ